MEIKWPAYGRCSVKLNSCPCYPSFLDFWLLGDRFPCPGIGGPASLSSVSPPETHLLKSSHPVLEGPAGQHMAIRVVSVCSCDPCCKTHWVEGQEVLVGGTRLYLSACFINLTTDIHPMQFQSDAEFKKIAFFSPQLSLRMEIRPLPTTVGI